MKGLKRKMYMVVLIAVMLVSLTACGEQKKNVKNEAAAETVEKPEGGNVEAEEAKIVETADIEKPEIEEVKTEKSENGEDIQEITESEGYTVVSDLKSSEGLEFESNGDGTCIIKGVGVCTDEDIVIPTESPKGDKVTLIDEYAFYGLEDVKSVTLINCEYEVEKYAFQYGKFESLNIIGGRPIINKSAFSSCEDLESIVISDCNLQADEYAFFDCGKDANVKISNCSGSIDTYAFQYSDMLTLEINNCELEIGKSVFSSCENLESITVNDTMLKADEYAFFGCGDSARVEMNNCEIVLDDYVFQYSSLESITISGTKLETGQSAFSSCDDLNAVVIDCDSLMLDEYTFFSCEDLINVMICENATEDTEIAIDDYAFQYCKKLETVTIGGSKIEMGKHVFSGCADGLKITNNGTVYTAESVEDGLSP